MNTPPARCLRPDCTFHPEPLLTEDGALDVSAYCSRSCQDWTRAAVIVAQSTYSTAIERQARRLYALKALLDLRENASEVDFEVIADA
ncbi:hypothetical protein [Streptomyces sp. NBC_01429]|uniref:hypothetical protein n=1 Tax=Streptomyces sp. NBC_01429 TaxID=2903862 RepID=UPI002E2D6FF2|nr:hypothetical protein [Streptomyces sp. NBC_01429]